MLQKIKLKLKKVFFLLDKAQTLCSNSIVLAWATYILMIPPHKQTKTQQYFLSPSQGLLLVYGIL